MSLTPTGLAGPAHHGPGPATESPPNGRPASRWRCGTGSSSSCCIGVLFWWFVWSAMADNPLGELRRRLPDDGERRSGGCSSSPASRCSASSTTSSASGRPRTTVSWVNLFARFEHRTAKFNDWNRFRVARVLKILLLLAILSLVLAAIFDVSPGHRPLRAAGPAVRRPALRAASWRSASSSSCSSSSGCSGSCLGAGIDVYFPEDIKTRFADVWGQDHVRRQGCRRTSSSSSTRTRSRPRAATCPAASCCTARPERARR